MAFATRIAKRLGKGWKPSVWENLGWHAQAVKGLLRVSGKRYRLDGSEHYLAQADDYGVLGQGNTPRRALSVMVNELHARSEQARARIVDLEHLIKKAS